MILKEQIITAFPKVTIETEISNDFILSNQNLMELKSDIDHFLLVPSYMLWCINTNNEEELVEHYTVNALAEYGKTKSKNNNYLNFMFNCSHEQKLAIIKFLEWCLIELDMVDANQIKRAIKNWSKSIS